jgi:hypothetical protein
MPRKTVRVQPDRLVNQRPWLYRLHDAKGPRVTLLHADDLLDVVDVFLESVHLPAQMTVFVFEVLRELAQERRD